MPGELHRANGQVIDINTGRGLAGVQIEVWDVDRKTDQPLGMVATDSEGRFDVNVDFLNHGFAVAPELEFKVVHRGTEIKAVRSVPVASAATTNEVLLEAVSAPPVEKDKINTAQFLKAVDFFQESDFGGVLQDVRNKAGARWGIVADALINAVTKLPGNPVKPKESSEKELLHKDVNFVKQKLEADNVQVEVHPYNPRPGKVFRDLKNFGGQIQPGQKVKLYQENGQLRYYTIEKQGVPEGGAPSFGNAQETKLQELQSALNAAKADALKKEEQIMKLREDLLAVRREQANIQELVQSSGFKKLMENLNRG